MSFNFMGMQTDPTDGHGEQKTTKRDSILTEICLERELQDKKWGIQNHPDGTGGDYIIFADYHKNVCDEAHKTGTQTWLNILKEEVYEAFAEEDSSKLEKELIQVAAVAVSWIEAIRRRKNANK